MQVIDTLHQSLNDPETRDEVLLYMGQVPIFTGLAQEQLLSIVAAGEACSYAAREVVFSQEAPGAELHVVLEGAVHLIRKVPTGEGKLVKKCEKGSSFGEIGFITGGPRNLSASAGPEGSLHLVIRRESFDKLLEAQPHIGLTIYQDLLDAIRRRLDSVPIHFRNYVMWGYRPPQMPKELDAQLLGHDISKATVMAGVGAGTGLVGALLASWLVPVIVPDIAPHAQKLALTLGLTATVVGGVLGQLAGGYYDRYEDWSLSERRHPRSCVNCKFVLWDEATGKTDCFYRVEKILQVTFRPGKRFDSYTDCPSFDALPAEEKIEKATRDQIKPE